MNYNKRQILENKLRTIVRRIIKEETNKFKNESPMNSFIAAQDYMDRHPSGERTLRDIAKEIRADWKNVNYGAKPYLDAMSQMTRITDKYYDDSGTSVVNYFLANAQSWHGGVAKKIKAELNAMVKSTYR